MKKIIIPIINLTFSIVFVFIFSPIRYIIDTLWNFKVDKKFTSGWSSVFTDWKQTLKDVFCDTFIWNE